MDAAAVKFIAIGFMALAMMGAAIGLGNIFSSALNSVARNPSVADKISKLAIVGAGLTEFVALMSFVVICILYFF